MIATYEYVCPDGHVTDVRRPMEDRDLPVSCGTCGAEAKRNLYPLDMSWRMGKEGIVRSRRNPGDSIGRIAPDRQPVSVPMRGGAAFRPQAA